MAIAVCNSNCTPSVSIAVKKRKHISGICLMMFLDAIILNASLAIGLLLRYDFTYSEIPIEYIQFWYKYFGVFTAVSIAILYVFKTYHFIWNFVGVHELKRVISGSIVSSVFGICGTIILGCILPLSVYCCAFVVKLFLLISLRCSYRVYHLIFNSCRKSRNAVNIMIVGAGEAGRMLIREIRGGSQINAMVRCVVDDNYVKKGKIIEGIPIVGGRYEIAKNIVKYNIQQIIFAIPSANAKTKKDILNICKDLGCTLKTVPGLYQLVNGDVNIGKLQDVQVEDLLGRESISVDIEKILNELNNKVVMVTGGGGSIGSELCRQIAKHNPRRLIIVDVYENNAYDIQQELKYKYPNVDLKIMIASVDDANRMDKLFDCFRPDIVYHAAAHKHVPLMEDSPNEAIKNNVFGTLVTAECADRYRTKKFVLISTDKAVNPTNIMGASKRLCEMIVQAFAQTSETDFTAVRFGNVLGSNGSVIPLLKKQIADGGPVTITHPDITRFFMTIPEAVSLVIQAGAYANGGEIFVLDMGLPVKIDDLARNLIRLSGYIPDKDITIKYIGLRPGEKLYEEMLMDEEGLQKTENKLILIGKPIEIDYEIFMEQLELLREESYSNTTNIKKIVAQMVPTYKPADNKKTEKINCQV